MWKQHFVAIQERPAALLNPYLFRSHCHHYHNSRIFHLAVQELLLRFSWLFLTARPSSRIFLPTAPKSIELFASFDPKAPIALICFDASFVISFATRLEACQDGKVRERSLVNALSTTNIPSSPHRSEGMIGSSLDSRRKAALPSHRSKAKAGGLLRSPCSEQSLTRL
mmetsp:Transcript_1152/g.2336  ORF Transcript_1152/g.2336 Transcript_1152/m.2336 type:complete len:168 (+) Transcript_1152:1159-1662(+)